MYQELIDKERLPQHIAIIMDGNGRWAKARGLERTAGHVEGEKAAVRLVKDAVRLGIKYITLYTFSTENWKRPPMEVKALMQLLLQCIEVEESLFRDNEVRLMVIGDTDKLPLPVRIKMNRLLDITKDYKRATLVIALSYSSRWEISNAARILAQEAKEGKIRPEDIDEDMFSSKLATNFMPDPELLVRTGGEVRLSNYLMWQASYSELYFCDTLWPDFDIEELCKAIYSYQQRERRFGLTGDQVSEKK